MSGANPQGVDVWSFKEPSAEELNHDYLWRTWKCLPERGQIGIFNRSYYEEVLVVRVHRQVLQNEKLPKAWSQNISGGNVSRISTISSATLPGTGLWWSSSSCISQKKNRSVGSWNGLILPTRMEFSAST